MLTFQPTSPVDDFIAYLNAEIRVSGNWAQDERDTEDGGMLEEVWWSPDDLEAQVHLQLKWAADDALESIVADSDGGGDWQPVVLNLLRRADQRAREADRALFDTVHRFAYIGRHLSGRFNFGSIRVEPWPYPDKPGVVSERVLLITIPFKGTDAQDAYSVSHGLASEFVAFFSLILGTGLYIIRREERWTADGRSTLAFPLAERGEAHPGRIDDHGTEIEFDLIGHRGNEIAIPAFAESLWVSVEKLAANDRRQFGRAASLFNAGCVMGRRYPSAQMSYHVASVDCLAGPGDRRKEAFHALIADLCPEAAEFARSKDIYSEYRSAHVHGGRFAAGEFQGKDVGPIRGFFSTGLSGGVPIWIRAMTATVLLRWLAKRSDADT